HGGTSTIATKRCNEFNSTKAARCAPARPSREDLRHARRLQNLRPVSVDCVPPGADLSNLPGAQVPGVARSGDLGCGVWHAVPVSRYCCNGAQDCGAGATNSFELQRDVQC